MKCIIGFFVFMLWNVNNSYSYEKCDSKNNYLEKGLIESLKTIKGEMTGFRGEAIKSNEICVTCNDARKVQIPFISKEILLLTRPRPPIPSQKDLKCVENAQIDYPIERFVNCKNTSDSISSGGSFKTVPKPCVSKNYVESTAILLRAVSDCAGVNARELFSTWNHESGLHMNMVSHTGAIGSGQVTSGAIDYMKHLEYYNGENEDSDHFTKEILDIHRKTVRDLTAQFKENPRCNSLASLATYYPKDASQSCELLSQPFMPAASFMIATKNYMVGRKTFEYAIDEMMKERSLKDQNEVIKTLSQYAYNGGIAGILSDFQTFYLLNSTPSVKLKKSITPRKLATKELLEEFSEYLKKNYGSSNTSQSRRNEVASYVSDFNVSEESQKHGINDMLKKSDQKLGDLCFN